MKKLLYASMLLISLISVSQVAANYTLTVKNSRQSSVYYYISYGGWCKHDEGTLNPGQSVNVDAKLCCFDWVADNANGAGAVGSGRSSACQSWNFEFVEDQYGRNKNIIATPK
jgi:hypothetical protein